MDLKKFNELNDEDKLTAKYSLIKRFNIDELADLTIDILNEQGYPSYSKLVEVKNNEKVEESIALLKDNQYEVTSSSLLIQEEFNSIVNLLMMAIEVFMSICIVISFMLFILIIRFLVY